MKVHSTRLKTESLLELEDLLDQYFPEEIDEKEQLNPLITCTRNGTRITIHLTIGDE